MILDKIEPGIWCGVYLRACHKEDMQLKTAKEQISPPKSLSDAGGGLCGLHVKYSFN